MYFIAGPATSDLFDVGVDSSEPERLSDTENYSRHEKIKDRTHLGSPTMSDLFEQSSNHDKASALINTNDISELQSSSEKEDHACCESRSFGEETNQDESDDFGCVSLDHSDSEEGTTGKATTSSVHSFLVFVSCSLYF